MRVDMASRRPRAARGPFGEAERRSQDKPHDAVWSDPATLEADVTFLCGTAGKRRLKKTYPPDHEMNKNGCQSLDRGLFGRQNYAIIAQRRAAP